uniref:Uncharacterized protein n=1 Tax=Anguilla anguilla TaxID=7936 RepID=A0A0E9XVE0_ANGAN
MSAASAWVEKRLCL